MNVNGIGQKIISLFFLVLFINSIFAQALALPTTTQSTENSCLFFASPDTKVTEKKNNF